MYALSDNTAPRDPRGTTMRTLLHQMRPWPPAWRRPVEDRPPYAVWVIGGLIVWAFLLAGFMVWDLHSTSRTTIWAIFAGWCIGLPAPSLARKIYREGTCGSNPSTSNPRITSRSRPSRGHAS